MKNIFLIFSSILFIASFYAQNSQIEIPYYMSFEDTLYINDWGIQQYPDPNDPLRIYPVNINQDFYGKSLHLKVKQGDNLYSSNPSTSRCEIIMKNGKHIINDGDEYYYSWDLYIPDNGDFPDDDSSGTWYNIMQWHPGNTSTSYCSNGIPPIRLEYLKENSSNNMRDLRLNYGTDYGGCTGNCEGDINFRGNIKCNIIDAVTKGEWNHIVTKIKWSYDGDLAYIEMWINGLPVVEDSNPDNTACNGPNQRVLGDLYETPDRFDSVPLLYLRSDSSNPPGPNDILQLRQKLGHYRNNYSTTNILYIDNYRITTEYPPSPFRTRLIETDCERTIGIDESYEVTAYKIDPNTLYKFRIQDGSNTYYYNSVSNSMNIFNRSWAKAKKTYSIDVRVENSSNNGQGFSFGDKCQVTTPHKTKLKSEYCDNLFLSNTIVECYQVLGATNYKFKVVDSNNNTYWFNNSQNFMDLSERNWFVYGEIYTIEVRVSTEDDEFAFWTQCQIRVPFIPASQTSNNNVTKAVKLFPNPTTGKVTIEMSNSDKVKKIQIFSYTGQLIKEFLNTNSITLTKFEEGIYFIRIISNDDSYIKRLIKR